MVPTEHGKMLYNSVVDAIKKLEVAEKHFFRNCDSGKSSISIGMCFETFQYVLEPYISTLPFNLISKFGDYSEMLNDLDKGLLDFVIAPQKDDTLNILYTPFSRERIIIIAGSQSDISEFKQLADTDNKACENWLNKQLWFGTNGDMEHLRNFWIQNFKKRPEFKPSYIVPNLTSIIRCISNREGFAVMPDFLCKRELERSEIKVVWEGSTPLDNTLYFAQRKKTMYEEEIKILHNIFKKEMIDL